MVEAIRSASADTSQSDMRKLYPPYPKEFEEQARNLEKLVGVRRLNESLSPTQTVTEYPDAPPVDVEKLKQSMRNALANSPSRGLTGQVNGIAGFLDS